MTFISTTEPEQQGLVTYDQDTSSSIFFEDNQLQITGDVEISGTITCNFIGEIFTKTSAEPKKISISDTLSGQNLKVNLTTIVDNKLVVNDIDGISLKTVSADIGDSTKISTNLETNNITSDSLKANYMVSDIFEISSDKNMFKINNLSVDVLETEGSIIFELTKLDTNSIKTKDFSASVITINDIGNKLSEFSNITSNSISATKILSTNFSITSGSISTRDITNISSLSGNSLNIFDSIPSMEISKEFVIGGNLISDNITANDFTGAKVTIAGNQNSITGTGTFVTNNLNAFGDVFTTKLESENADLELESISFLNGASVFDSVLSFKSINDLENITGSLNGNANSEDSTMKMKSIDLTGDTTTTKLIPNKIVVNDINANSINDSGISDTLISTETFTGKDFTFSGQMFVENIKSSRTLNINANVDIETTLFTDGDIDTYSIITCRLIETPILTNVTTISSTEHYFEDSVINGVSFDDDGIITLGEYDTPSVSSKNIQVSTITTPLKINNTVDISNTLITGRNLESKTKIIADTITNTSNIASTNAKIHTITTGSISITSPIEGVADNKINLKTIKSAGPVSVAKDFFAAEITNANTNLNYKVQVHIITESEILPFPPTGTSGTINNVKLVKDLIVLVKDQSDQTENGIYIVSDGVWSRHSSMLDTTDAVNATVTNYIDSKIYYNTETPCVVGTDNVVFVEYNGIELDSNYTVNDTNTFNTGIMTSTSNIVSKSGVSTDSLTVGSLGLSGGVLDITSESSINGMTTTSDHLEGVTNINTDTLNAGDIILNELNVQAITGKSTFGGITFNNSSLEDVADIISENVTMKSMSTSGTLVVSKYIGDVISDGVEITDGTIKATNTNINVLNINNASLGYSTGTYNFKFPDTYSSETVHTALSRTDTESNTWSVVPDAKAFGSETELQYQHNSKLTTTSDLSLKNTATLYIEVSSNGYSLKNTNNKFTDGTYDYSDENVSFDVDITSGEIDISNVTVLPGNVYDVELEIPVNNYILKTTKIKASDIVLTDSRVQNITGNTVIESPGDIITRNGINYNNAYLGDRSSFSNVTNGSVVMSSNGNFTGVDEPTDPSHPSTKNYVDTSLQTFKWTDSVDYVYQQNVNNYTGNAFNPINIIFIDGINISSLQDGITLLLVGQTDPVENGIYLLSNNKTILTRVLTGEVAGKSTHVKKGDTNKDAVYVCIGDSVIAGTDESIYTQLVDGKYSFSNEIISNGEVNRNLSDFNIVDNKLTTTSSINYSKLSKTGFGMNDELGYKVITIGNYIPTKIKVSNNKSFVGTNESYTGHKNFTNVVSNGEIVSENAEIIGNAVSDTLPFLDGTTMNINNINNLSGMINYDTPDLYTLNISLGDISSNEYSLLLGQTDPSENGFYNFASKANLVKPFSVNSRYIINDDGFIQDIKLIKIEAESINSPIINSNNIRTPVLKSDFRVDVDETKITQNDVNANTMKVRKVIIKDISNILVDTVSFSDVSLSGTGSFAENTIILVRNNTDSSENGVYIVKDASWPKLSSKFAKDQNGIVFRISDDGTILPFVKKTYEFSNVSSIGNSYTADYYSDKPLHLIGSYVDGIKVSVDETVLIKNDGIYKISNTNWIKTNFFQEGEVCAIQKGEKYNRVSFVLRDGETRLNYDYIVDFILTENISLVTSEKPEGTRLLLTGQNNKSDNGIYTVQSDLSLFSDITLEGLNDIISLEDYNTLLAEDNTTFYAEPNDTVDYYNIPQNPFVHDTYTDGTSVYKFSVNNNFEKTRDVSNGEYIYISKLQKTLHNGLFVNFISKPKTFVTISDVKFVNNTITGITEIHSSSPTDDVFIDVSNLGTNLLSSVELKSDNVIMPEGTLVTKSENTIVNDFKSENATIRGSVNVDSVNYEILNVNSDTSMNNTVIKHTGTKIVDVVTTTNVPSGLTDTTAKHGDLVLLLDNLGVHIVNKDGAWIPVIPSPEEPFIYKNTRYTKNNTFNIYEAVPLVPGDNTIDVYTKDIQVNADANITDITVNGDISLGTFVSENTLDIYQNGSYVSVGMKYVIADTHYVSNLTNLSTVDPLNNASDTIGRGYITDVQIFPGAKVLLVGQAETSENGLYLVKVSSWVKSSNPENLSYSVNGKYYDHEFAEIFPNENTIINIVSGIIDTPFYETETKIDTDNGETVSLFANVNSTLTIGSTNTQINARSINVSSELTFDNLVTDKLILLNNLESPDITISGNINSEKLLKFNKTISLNSVDISNVNNLQVNKGIECDSMVTPVISHSGAFDIHSVVADTVVEDTTLTSKNTISIPEFNNYEFSGIHAYGNVSAVYNSIPVLYGEHSNLFEGDIVIVNEPQSETITNHIMNIPNAKSIEEILLPESIKVTDVIANTSGYGLEFRQTRNNKMSVYIINNVNNTHGYDSLGNKIPINTDISITVSGYQVSSNNGVYAVVKEDSWSRINNENIEPVSIELEFFYKTVNKPIVVTLPYKLLSVPQIEYDGVEATTRKISEDTLVIDLNNGYSDEFTKIDESGTFTIKDSNRSAIMKNVFTRSDKLYILDSFEVYEKEWFRINYVIYQNTLIPSLDNYQPIIIGSNTLQTGEMILLTNQTNIKENGLYILQNKLLLRPDGYDEQDIINEFIWDSYSGFGYYVYGMLGNFINIQKTPISHPHASEKIITNRLITNEILCPLPNVNVFANAPNVSMEIDDITSKDINLQDLTITTPSLLMKGTMTSNDVIKIETDNITLEQSMISENSISFSGKQDININGLKVSQIASQVDKIKNAGTTTSVKILNTKEIKSTNNINMPDFEFNNTKLRSNTLQTGSIDNIPFMNSGIFNTEKVTVENIDTKGPILFSDENVVAMRIVGSSVDIPRMNLPKVESSPQGPTNTSVFTNATGQINAFVKANTINLNTTGKTVGYNSFLKMNAGILNLNADELKINRPMNNDTKNLIVYGDLTVNRISSSKNLKIGGDGENIVLGQNFFNISSKLNTINFTTDLELDSFLGKAKGVSVGDRRNTGVLAINTNKKVEIRGRDINLSYLKNVPAFKWQPNVDVICDYPLDLAEPVYIINKTDLVQGMSVLVTENKSKNGVYTVKGDNTLDKLNSLTLTHAYSEKLGQGKSYYVSDAGKAVSNDIDLVTVSEVESYIPSGENGEYKSFFTEDISNVGTLIVSFKFKFTKQFTEQDNYPAFYFNNVNKIHYIQSTNTVRAVFFNESGDKSYAVLDLPGDKPEIDKEYSLKVTFHLSVRHIEIQLLGHEDITYTYTPSNHNSLLREFKNDYILGYDNWKHTLQGTRDHDPVKTLRNAEMYNFKIQIPDVNDQPINKTYFTKDQYYDVLGNHTSNMYKEMDIDYKLKPVVIFDFIYRNSTLTTGFPTFVSCNGNKIYFQYGYGFHASFKVEGGTETDELLSSVRMSASNNVNYNITATYDYGKKTVQLVVNGQNGVTVDNVNPELEKTFKPMIGKTYVGHVYPLNDHTKGLKNAILTNLNIYTPGYAPVVPKVIDVTDTLKIVGKYIPVNFETQNIKVDTNLLDSRSEISITPGGYKIKPKLIVKSSDTFSIIRFGTSGAPISTTAKLEYQIKLFNYNRKDRITLLSGENSKNFIFTDTKYKFERKFESISFNFSGHNNLVFSGELLDSYSSIRKDGYTNFNTWVITVKRVSDEDETYYNFDLDYLFVVNEYPKVITPNVVSTPNIKFIHKPETNQYVLSEYKNYDHVKEPLNLRPQKPDLKDTLTYVEFKINSQSIKVDGVNVGSAINRWTPYFRFKRIPNIYNLKPGCYVSETNTTSSVTWRRSDVYLNPDKSYYTYFRYNSRRTFSINSLFEAITVSSAEKYRVVPIVSYVSQTAGRGNFYYAIIDENGNIVIPDKLNNDYNIRLRPLIGTQRKTKTTGATMQVFDDYIYVSVDNTNTDHIVKIPVKNQPEFSFPTYKLTFKPQSSNIQVTGYDNEIMSGTSILYNNVFKANIYKIPNTKGYASGIYTDYKFNKTQGLKRTVNIKNIVLYFRYNSTYRILYSHTRLGKGVIIEDLSVNVLSSANGKRLIIIPYVYDNTYVTFVAFPEDGSLHQTTLVVQADLRLSFVETNFEVDQNTGNFDFEIPVDMTGMSSNFNFYTLNTPGGIVNASSLKLTGNNLSGNITKRGPKIHQGTYYHSFFDSNNPNGRSTGVHITSENIYFIIRNNAPLNEPITIPTYRTETNFKNLEFATHKDYIPTIENSNMVLRPKLETPIQNLYTRVVYADFTITNPTKIMSLLPNNVIIKNTDPIGFKKILKVNDDTVDGGSYDLSYDKNTEELAFVPERIYSSSGSAEVLYKYKIEINSKKQLIIEKKRLNKDVESTDNESFRLSIYRVNKPPKQNNRRLYINDDKAVVNIPKKTKIETNNFHLAKIKMNSKLGFSDTIYKTPVFFSDFVVAKFEKVDRVTFGCEKISGNEFKISAHSQVDRILPIEFQVMFVDSGLISNEIKPVYENFNGFPETSISYRYSDVNHASRIVQFSNRYSKHNYNDCITYVQNTNLNDFSIEATKTTDGKYLKVAFIPNKKYDILNGQIKYKPNYSVKINQHYTTNEDEKGKIVIGDSNFIKPGIVTLNDYIIPLNGVWRHFNSEKFITLPYYNSDEETVNQTFYFFKDTVGLFNKNNEGYYYHPQNWYVIGFNNEYVVISEDRLKLVYNNNNNDAFNGLHIPGKIAQDITDARNVQMITHDIMTDMGIDVKINYNLNNKTMFELNTAKSVFDPEKYEAVKFTVFYKNKVSRSYVTSTSFDGKERVYIYTSQYSRSFNNIDNNRSFPQPNVIKKVIVGNKMILELDNPFTGLVRYSLKLTEKIEHIKQENNIKQVKSVSGNFVNNDPVLLEFNKNNETVYTSVNSIPYPSRFSKDYFNSSNALMGNKPLINEDNVSVPNQNENAIIYKDVAIETFMTNRQSYVFRLNVNSSASLRFNTSEISLENYPELLLKGRNTFKIEHIGPLADNSYRMKNSTEYTYFAIINVRTKTLTLFIRNMLGTPWSNTTFWKVTVLPQVEKYNTVRVEDLVE